MLRNKPKFIFTQNGVKAVGNCVFTGEYYETAEFSISAYENYAHGAYIQDALYMLSPEDREFILTSISPKGWDGMITDDENMY